MRIASTQFESTMNRAMQLNQAKLLKLNAQMASGNRVELPSDDPISAVRLSRLTREEAMVGQYRNNIGALKIRLQKNEAFLSGMNTDMQQTRDLLVWALDGGNASADLQAMVSTLQSLRDSLYFSANSKDEEGRYVFSGTLSDTPTVSFDAAQPAGSRYTFTGNTEQQLVVVGNGVTQKSNVSLDDMHTLLNQLDSTMAVLAVPGVNINDPAVRSVVAANLDGVDAAMESTASRIASLGGAQNIIATLDGNHSNVSLSNKLALLDLGQLDVGAAAIDLNGYTMAIESSQKAYAKVSQLSLFDLL